MSAVASLKLLKRDLVARYATPGDAVGLFQSLTTLLPIIVLWGIVAADAGHSAGVVIAASLSMSLFLLRGFALMHDCGHGCLFRSAALNRSFGFLFGLLSGMPQYVWAQHHNFHHATNGNWAKYRGPMATLSIGEYDALSGRQQRNYARLRNVWLAPLAGFLYLVFNPRFTWLTGSARFAWHLLRAKSSKPDVSWRTHAASAPTPCWADGAEFRHMTMNNVGLLIAWLLMSWLVGPALFFTVYLISVSLAGGAGIVLFTVQHNFEHAYASGDLDWDYDTAAIDGTSYLVLPGWLNWFTADIGYHHIHHLSARIPNYRLARCHSENQQLFTTVRRLTLADVRASLKFMLWDTTGRRIISVAEHEASRLSTVPA